MATEPIQKISPKSKLYGHEGLHERIVVGFVVLALVGIYLKVVFL